MRLVDDPDFTLHVGDVREVLRELPDESVHCVVTSPPYWGLRDYGAEGQLGLEATPELYVENMVAVFREVRRVLRRDGTCWVNLGDSYAGGTGTNRPDPERDARIRRSREKLGGSSRGIPHANGRPVPGLKPKDLVGIPWRVAFALQADGWYLRSDIVWSKPNPMPESVTDRPTKAHEYVFLLTREPRYFFDADAVREPNMPGTIERFGKNPTRQGAEFGPRTIPPGHPTAAYPQHHQNGLKSGLEPLAGRNLRSVWEIATQPYAEAHFATYPQALVERCLKAGCPEWGVCPECGAPWVREVEKGENIHPGSSHDHTADLVGPGAQRHSSGIPAGTIMRQRFQARSGTREVGWRATCEHEHEPVPATVLDPFLGSGTTALVARRLGRRCVGIELSPEYAALAAKRLQQLSLLAGVA